MSCATVRKTCRNRDILQRTYIYYSMHMMKAKGLFKMSCSLVGEHMERYLMRTGKGARMCRGVRRGGVVQEAAGI